MFVRVLLHPVHRSGPDSPLGHVDNPSGRQVVAAVVNGLQVGQKVLDLLAGIEIDAAHDFVGDIVHEKLLFKHTGLGVGAVQNGTVSIVPFPLAHLGVDGACHVFPFFKRSGKHPEVNGLAVSVGRPEGLALSPRVVPDHLIGRGENVLGGTVILLQPDHPGVWKDLFKIQDVGDVGPPKFIDGLVIVSYHEEVPVFPGQHAHQLELDRIGILVFVHHDKAKPLLVVFQDLRAGGKQLHRLHEQIVKVQGVAGPFSSFWYSR